jgi:hypothetical protein
MLSELEFLLLSGCFVWIMLIVNRAINLTKNSQFYVRQADVERLIAQGYLQKLG